MLTFHLEDTEVLYPLVDFKATSAVFLRTCSRWIVQVLLKGASIAVKDHIGAQEVSWRLRLAERL